MRNPRRSVIELSPAGHPAANGAWRSSPAKAARCRVMQLEHGGVDMKLGVLSLVALCGLAFVCAGCENGGMAFSYSEHSRRHGRHVGVVAGSPGPVVVQQPVVVERPVVVEQPVVVGQPVIVEQPGVVVERRPVTRVHEGPQRVEVDRGAEVRVYDRRRGVWVVVDRGHVHGPHCGHILVSGRWEIR